MIWLWPVRVCGGRKPELTKKQDKGQCHEYDEQKEYYCPGYPYYS